MCIRDRSLGAAPFNQPFSYRPEKILFRTFPSGSAQLWAIWGPSSENGGSKVIKSVPKELKEKYQQVFA